MTLRMNREELVRVTPEQLESVNGGISAPIRRYQPTPTIEGVDIWAEIRNADSGAA